MREYQTRGRFPRQRGSGSGSRNPLRASPALARAAAVMGRLAEAPPANGAANGTANRTKRGGSVNGRLSSGYDLMMEDLVDGQVCHILDRPSKKQVCLFYCSEMADLAASIAEDVDNIELKPIEWGKFEDGFPNLFVPNAHGIRGRHVAFLASFSSPAVIFEQLSIIYAIPRMFVESFTLVLPFFPTGTSERMEDEGDVATAFTLSRILSNIPISRGGPTSLVIFDIHALQVLSSTGGRVFDTCTGLGGWALGMGGWALGMGGWALGMGGWALGWVGTGHGWVGAGMGGHWAWLGGRWDGWALGMGGWALGWVGTGHGWVGAGMGGHWAWVGGRWDGWALGMAGWALGWVGTGHGWVGAGMGGHWAWVGGRWDGWALGMAGWALGWVGTGHGWVGAGMGGHWAWLGGRWDGWALGMGGWALGWVGTGHGWVGAGMGGHWAWLGGRWDGWALGMGSFLSLSTDNVLPCFESGIPVPYTHSPAPFFQPTLPFIPPPHLSTSGAVLLWRQRAAVL
ncbi:unnamed protein product [Closterium sp. NIES-65]|nr:unnamed protein product [Closterium sp. NIES-65]CAI5971258.1 unnamed protein product [Closterium sp. NIES-65]